MRRCALSLGLFVALTGVVYADESGGGFFSHNYARNPLDGGGEVPVGGAEGRPSGMVGENVSDEKRFPEAVWSDGGGETTEQGDESTVVEAAAKILALSMVVSTTDRVAMAASIRELGRVAVATNIPVASLYVVGDGEVLGQVMESIVGADPVGFVHLVDVVTRVDSVPKEYPVQSSPAWVFETEGGVAIAEGVPSPRPYIGSRGELLRKG